MYRSHHIWKGLGLAKKPLRRGSINGYRFRICRRSLYCSIVALPDRVVAEMETTCFLLV